MFIVGIHDHFLVILSVLIAAFASYTALSLAGRMRASVGLMRRAWLGAAAITLGGGIWSMHFVAMLAFSVPGMSISYDIPLSLLSLATPIAFTTGGLIAMSWGVATSLRVVVSGLLMGTGVAAMHYMGMAAMRMDATLSYERLWLSLSVLIAIGAATAATWLASRDQQANHRAAAAIALGGAIAGMHYAGMKAAVFTAARQVDHAGESASLSQTYLAIGITVVTLAILLLALGAAQIDRAFNAYARREARIAMRLSIADVLRGQHTRSTLQDMAAMIGAHFSASQAGFAQFDPENEEFQFETCWSDGSVAPLAGTRPAEQFGSKLIAELNAGRTVIVEDSLQHSREEPARIGRRGGDLQTRSLLIVPFLRDERLWTIVFVADRFARGWHADDVLFLEELAERTRLVIERAEVENQLRQMNATLEARVEARSAQLRQAEEARREADALYRAYFQNTPDPLFVLGVGDGPTFIVEQINPAHEGGVGFKLEAIKGKRIDEVLPADTATRVVEAYRHVVETAKIFSYRDIFTLGERSQYWDTTLIPMTNDQGQVVRIFGSSRDVTAQILSEEALRQSQKMEAMGQLTGGVAHDFNNLLTPIIGSLDRLQRKGLGDERDQKLVAGAMQAAERAKTLVQRLLSFARRQPLQTVPVNIVSLVNGMADLISSTVGPRIATVVEMADDLPPALADPNQLEMALLNLSVNARDAMPDGGTLRIAASALTVGSGELGDLQPGEYVCLSVTDDGVGMDEATARRAVDPFFSTKGVGRGTGLGLSMVHGLAAQLGGRLTIKSKPGLGTQIQLCLPRSNEAPASDMPAHEPIVAPSIGTVLLVDDEDLVRDTTTDMLIDLGYQVHSARCAAEAIELIDKGLVPDYLVTDHLMPGQSGTELAWHVLGVLPATKVIIISGYAEANGADPRLSLLSKPFVQAELAAKLARLSEGPST
ncbi:MHYT domain-containing protein [Novosphingobium sp. RD2P27]|uniref:histidine kinase n=1 Tax=Novosphingobium kalidii TaxID=3230299 RepID=A0ABV2D2J4_9SPHN